MKKKFGICACGEIGRQAIRLFENDKESLKFVLLDKSDFWKQNDKLLAILSEYPNTAVEYYENDSQLLSLINDDVDAVILAFWSKLIKGEVLAAPKYGYINLHTSYLPYGKGKHPHCWSILDETSYGATIMKINQGLDTGGILFQKTVEKDWTDTGKSLYFKSMRAMGELLREHKEDILSLELNEHEQSGEGTIHKGSELETVSKIELDEEYTARRLLNILRAKSFMPFPAAWFEEDGKEYEVRILIEEKKEKKDGFDYDAILSEYETENM